MHYLYLLTNLDLNKLYVGVTNNPRIRLNNHMRHYTNSQIMLDRELYRFEMEILAIGSKEFIYSLEEETIQLLKSRIPNGYNVARGGIGGWKSDQRGSKNPASKINETDVLEIRKLASEGLNYTKIGNMFNLSQPTISGIASGKQWTHVDGPITIKPIRDNGGSQRLSNEIISRVKELRAEGTTYTQIASILSISTSSAHKWANK